MVVNGIDVTVNGLNDVSEQEIVNYIDYVQAQTKEKVNSLKLSATKDGQVDIRYELQPQKFERIRRITGYLVGTIDRWNDAKRAEEHDRVKHGVLALDAEGVDRLQAEAQEDGVILGLEIGEREVAAERLAGLDDNAADAIRREAMEESGYAVEKVDYLFDMYASPGTLTEKVSLFVAHIDLDVQAGHGGGLESEGEDLEVLTYGLDEAFAMIASGEITDSKTIILLQWAMLNRHSL